MLKRIIMMLALGAALVACSPSGSGTETLAPVDSAAPVDSGLPSEMPSESASPS